MDYENVKTLEAESDSGEKQEKFFLRKGRELLPAGSKVRIIM